MKMGDLPASKTWPAASAAITAWLRDALDREEDWLRDLGEDGLPRRLMACEDYSDLIDEVSVDFNRRPFPLPGR